MQSNKEGPLGTVCGQTNEYLRRFRNLATEHRPHHPIQGVRLQKKTSLGGQNCIKSWKGIRQAQAHDDVPHSFLPKRIGTVLPFYGWKKHELFVSNTSKILSFFSKKNVTVSQLNRASSENPYRVMYKWVHARNHLVHT